jgi:cation diffusion facilitator CzcD-associated flavoprotein CzcO
MTPTPTTLPAVTEIAIVGGGFSGLGMAIRLKQAGQDDFVVLERGDDVGGTWHWNAYPGCGCDVPSNLYSFSFAPNPEWTRTYSRQPEIGAYLRRCADDFGVRPHIATGCSVTGATWDEAAQRWTVATSSGTLSARVLVSAAGPLFEPKQPAAPGLEDFEGRVFHSARWDHDYDVRGKRVAAVGTGASAIQFVPEIAPDVEQLHVFQRTPPWVMPHPGRPTTGIERAVYKRFPLLQKAARAAVYAGRESLVLGFVKYPRILRAAEAIARRHMRQSISDPALVRKVTPDYTLGCKRILPSNDWYPALDRPNVELHTGGLKAVTRTGVVTADGVEHPVDAIIFGTGFQVTDMPIAHRVRGAGGRTLAEHWGPSMRAHRGCTVPGFPNLFMLLGPNTGLGHGSMVYMIESQVAYVLDALRTMRERGAATAEVRADAEAAWNAELDAKLEGTVWNSGCASWYADSTGRIAALWPDWTFAFRRGLRTFDGDSYELRAPSRAPEPVAA